MKPLDIAWLAYEAVTRNWLRTGLTVLGVVIGIAAVIVMVTIGNGATAKVEADIARLGTRIITLAVGQQGRGGGGARIASKPFDYSDVEALRRQMRGLQSVVPVASRSVRVVAARRNATVTVIGTENDYFSARGWRLERGRVFSGYEAHVGKPVCVIGETVRAGLFAGQDALGQMLRIGSIGCTVVGVLARRGQSGAAADDDDIVAMPFDAFQRRVQGSSDISSILMTVHDAGAIARVKTSVRSLIRERRALFDGAPDDFALLDMREIARTMAAANRTMTTLLAWIAAIGLLVGGIGIMNIMLVSVAERTHEIGIRLAIGALPSQVRAQFVTEAVILAGIGGAAGTVVGLAVSLGATRALALPFSIDFGSVATALTMSCAVGLAFGIGPAERAARLEPVVALRQR